MVRPHCPPALGKRVSGKMQLLLLACLALLASVLSSPVQAITLASGGSSSYVIAKRSGCDSTTSQAATDIQTYLKTISGMSSNIPINSYANLGAVPAQAIVIGDLVTSPTLALEQVEMKVSGQQLILRGGSSLATRYAVFTFLQDQLGVRYYSPTVEKVPTQSTITISDSYTSTQSPSFNMRYIYQGDVTNNATWAVKLRVNGACMYDETHNMYDFVPVATYFSSHPEYYPLHSGVRNYNNSTLWLCFTNTDLPAIIASRVNSRMAASSSTPELRITVAQGDASDSCECASCQSAYSAEGNSWNGVMLRCLNAAADIVAQTYPNRKMLTYAYMHTEQPGAVTAPVANLQIRYHHWRDCDLHALTECSKQNSFKSTLDTWDANTAPGQLAMWYYTTNFESNTMPWPNVRALVPSIKYLAEHGVSDLAMQGVYNGPGGDLSYLKCYLMAQALWNKDVDYTTIYNDFTDGYYGAAGDEMRAYIDLLEDRCRDASLNWHPDGINVTESEVKSKLLPTDVLAEADALYQDALDAAEAVSQTLYDRVLYDQASLLYAHIYNKQRLERISSPADRLVKLGDNNYYEWKKTFFDIIGSRIVGSEFSSWWRQIGDLRPQQAGNIYSAENSDIKVSVCPWIQGAIVSVVDKATGKELIHSAKTYYDTSSSDYDESPFNGFLWNQTFAGKYSSVACYKEAAMDADCDIVTNGDGSKTITITYEYGTGAWSPSHAVRRSTKTITIPASGASFEVAESVFCIDDNNITGTPGTYDKLMGRLFLGGDNFMGTIRVTKPDDSTQDISSFPTTLNAKKVYFDNTEYGVRMEFDFTDMPASPTSLTIGKNDLYSYNTYTGKFDCGVIPILEDETLEMLRYTCTLSSITATPSAGSDVIWQNNVNTVADQQFGSLLFKNTGGAAYNADAVSTQTMTDDGWLQWQFMTPGVDQTMGLNPTDADNGLNIKYAIRTYNGSSTPRVRVWETNSYKGPVLTGISSNDVWRIERAGNTIYYKRNGVTFYTSTVASTGDLLVDACLFTTGTFNGLRRCKLSFDAPTGSQPTCSLTAPSNGSVYLSPGTISLTATASDTDGTISKVEFYNNGDLLGEATSNPYSYNWTATSGMCAITARAYDNDGNVTTSSTANITVWLTQDIGSVGVAGSASYSSGAYTVNGAGAGINSTADAFRFVYMQISGDCTIIGRITTWGTGGSTSASRAGLVLRDGLNAGDRYFGATWRRDTSRNRHNKDYRASTNGSVSETYVDNTTIPYWFKVVRATNQDTGAITCTAYRSSDGSTWATCTGTPSATISGWNATNYIGIAVTSGLTTATKQCVIDNVTVKGENLAPSVELTAPLEGAVSQEGTNIALAADAADEDGTVSKVEFYNGTTKLGEDTSSPYTYDWASVPAGSYALTAKAIDNESKYTVSTVVNVKSNDAPSVSITSPGASSTLYDDDVTIEVSTSDTDGMISLVEFYEGTTKLGDSNVSPFTFVWVDVANGQHTITAKATDNDGGYTTSSGVTFTVDANTAPTVSITDPTEDEVINGTFTIYADAADADGAETISLVEFYQGTTKLGEDSTSPYSYEWSSPTPAEYALTAKVYDQSTSTTSAAVNIRVNDPPTVSITAPTNNASYTAPASISITVNASDADSTGISKVEFYADNGTSNTLIGSDTSATNGTEYSFNWTGVSGGNYTLTAVATDTDNGTKTSSGIAVVVTVPPTVSLTAPADGTIIVGNTYTLTADASDTGGTIDRVEFWADNGSGNTLIGSDTTATNGTQYSFNWTNVTCGVYEVTAKAIDNDDDSTTTSANTLTVWNTQDIGSVPTAGSSSYNSANSYFSVSGSGLGCSGSTDAFRFTYLPVSGNFTFIGRIRSMSTSTNHRGGLMVRETLGVGSKMMTEMLRNDGSNRWYPYGRNSTNGSLVGGISYVSSSTQPSNTWVKIVRTSTNVTLYYANTTSIPPASWTQHTGTGNPMTVSMTDPIYVGFAMCTGYATGGNGTMTVDNVSITYP